MTPDQLKLERQGRFWALGTLSEDILANLDRACQVKHLPGVRLDWSIDLAEAIGESSRLTTLARRLLPGARPVRIVIFNKSGDVNWQVPWHQDRVVAVREKHDIRGFENWTRKSGVWHVEPPIKLLRSMMFARVHLDDTDEQNGCLEIALGTHGHGKVNADKTKALAQSAPLEMCRARRGDVLFVKALVLHRSGASQHEADRRTLRIDYSAEQLPEPLQWAL